MSLTMRQLVGFTKSIQARLATQDYSLKSFHAKLAGTEMNVTLEEVLQKIFGDEPLLNLTKSQDDKLILYAQKKQKAELERLARDGRL